MTQHSPPRSKGRNRALSVICFLTAALAHPAHAQPSQAPPADELAEILRAQDSQFDNIAIRFTESGTVELAPFPAWKNPRFAKQHGLESDSGATIEYSLQEALVVRKGEVTYEFNVRESKSLRGSPDLFIAGHQKWSNALDHVYDYSASDDSASVTIFHNGPGENPGDNHSMHRQFALGFGFGKRGLSIHEVSRVDTGELAVVGTIQLPGGKQAECNILLDPKHYIARRAALTLADDNGWSIQITTKGYSGDGGFKCASQGTFEKKSSIPSYGSFDNFSLHVTGCESQLNDSEYAKLVAMPSRPGMQIIDPHELSGGSRRLPGTHAPGVSNDGPQGVGLPFLLTLAAAAVLSGLVVRKWVRGAS